MFSINRRFDKHRSCHLQGKEMVTEMFAETLVNTQHSTRQIPESRSYTWVTVVGFCKGKMK
jgi:hypothetical protein